MRSRSACVASQKVFFNFGRFLRNLLFFSGPDLALFSTPLPPFYFRGFSPLPPSFLSDPKPSEAQPFNGCTWSSFAATFYFARIQNLNFLNLSMVALGQVLPQPSILRRSKRSKGALGKATEVEHIERHSDKSADGEAK